MEEALFAAGNINTQYVSYPPSAPNVIVGTIIHYTCTPDTTRAHGKESTMFIPTPRRCLPNKTNERPCGSMEFTDHHQPMRCATGYSCGVMCVVLPHYLPQPSTMG